MIIVTDAFAGIVRGKVGTSATLKADPTLRIPIDAIVTGDAVELTTVSR
jgi:hypothetical protein